MGLNNTSLRRHAHPSIFGRTHDHKNHGLGWAWVWEPNLKLWCAVPAAVPGYAHRTPANRRSGALAIIPVAPQLNSRH